MIHNPASSRPALRHWLIAGVTLAIVTLLLAGAPDAMARTVHGTNGIDFLRGGFDNDLILGYAGNDELVGSWGDDTVAGHDGHDRLYGSPGNDLLNGGNGNDMLAGGLDLVKDTLHCGYGWDTAYVRRGGGDVTTGCEVVYTY